MTRLTVSSMQQTFETALEEAWTAAWDRGEVEALASICTDSYSRTGKSDGNSMTLAQFQDEIRATRAGFPDLTTKINSVIVNGDRAAIFWTTSGTHTETFLGVPATGKSVVTRGSNEVALHDGLIQSENVTWDGSELLNSLGIRSLSDAIAAEKASDEPVLMADLSGEPDLDAMKAFNRQFVTGVTVVTTQENGKPKGLAVNAYSSISLEPPLVMVCVQKTSSTYPALFASTHLGINILSREQKDTVSTFASKSADKFADIVWHEGPDGSPLIDSSSAMIEAEIRERFQAKTHTIFVCRVRHAEVSNIEPMVYKAGRFYDGANLESL
ncbi:flavin reductase [Arthrobacter sp. MYb221]|nr:flavin reductase [Arthrobacter sp. MYb221]